MSRYATTDPRTGEIVARYDAVSDAEVDAAVGRADEAYRDWRRTEVSERAAVLQRVADLYRERKQELAELNFYQGPINGYDTPQTVAAVKDLQRQAGLPQTSHMDTQTRAALVKYLEQGDNVMNG